MGEVIETTFGALGELFDGPHATPTRRSKGPYFLNISSLQSGRLDLAASDHVSPEDFVQWTRRVTPQSGDLLFSYETRLGEAALMPDGVEACLGRRMALLRPNRFIVDPRFLLYYYLSPTFQKIIRKHMVHGATVPRIGLATMPDWEISIPELPTQRAIAEVLGALDDKIAANDRLARLTLELGDAMFLTALRTETHLSIGELADRSVLEYGDGYRTKRAEHGRPGLRILRAGDIRNLQVFADGDDFVSCEYVNQIGSKQSMPDDVVMTTKGTVGRVAVVDRSLEPMVYSPQLCYFRVKDNAEFDAAYLAAWFRSADRERQSEVLMYKSDMAPYINLRDIRSLQVPIPEPDELRRQGEQQRVLLDRFNSACAENLALAHTRDELLPLLMSGKIRVKDAEAAVSDVC